MYADKRAPDSRNIGYEELLSSKKILSINDDKNLWSTIFSHSLYWIVMQGAHDNYVRSHIILYT